MTLLLLLKFWREAVIAVLMFLLLLCLFLLNSKTAKLHQADAKCLAQIQTIEQKQQAAVIAAQAKAREAEQKAAQQVSDIERKLHEQQTQSSNDQARLISSVHNGDVSLRERFTCPADATNLPKAATNPSRDTPTEKRGLLKEDAEFLISESYRADQVTNQLTACQDMLVKERS